MDEVVCSEFLLCHLISESSFAHQHLVKGNGFVFGTHWSTVLCMAAVSMVSSMLNSSISLIGCGGPIAAMCAMSCVQKSSHSATCQLKQGIGFVLSGMTSSALMTEKWSVQAGHCCSHVLHSMKGGRRSALQKTLSGWEKFLLKFPIPSFYLLWTHWVSLT